MNSYIRSTTDPIRTVQDYAKDDLSWHGAVAEIEENLTRFTNKEIAELMLQLGTLGLVHQAPERAGPS